MSNNKHIRPHLPFRESINVSQLFRCINTFRTDKFKTSESWYPGDRSNHMTVQINIFLDFDFRFDHSKNGHRMSVTGP